MKLDYLETRRISSLIREALILNTEGKQEFATDYLMLAARHMRKYGCTGLTVTALDNRTLSFSKKDIPDMIEKITAELEALEG